jgi:hypothetical protein
VSEAVSEAVSEMSEAVSEAVSENSFSLFLVSETVSEKVHKEDFEVLFDYARWTKYPSSGGLKFHSNMFSI